MTLSCRSYHVYANDVVRGIAVCRHAAWECAAVVHDRRGFSNTLGFLALTWFMCQKTFDGKKPYGFLKSVIAYLVRPKLTYAGKTVKLGKDHPAESITAVRSGIYGISD